MRTAAEALDEHGLTGEALLGLSRKAANDALRRAGAFLDQDRFEDLADYMLEVGVRYATRYEPGHGIAIQTFLYRRMRVRYTDWLRSTRGDSRNESSTRFPPGGLFSLDELTDTAVIDPGYDEVVTQLADQLDPAYAWTVVHLAAPLVAGWKLGEVATAAGITVPRARRQLDELQDALADRSPAPSSPPERWTRTQRPIGPIG